MNRQQMMNERMEEKESTAQEQTEGLKIWKWEISQKGTETLNGI